MVEHSSVNRWKVRCRLNVKIAINYLFSLSTTGKRKHGKIHQSIILCTCIYTSVVIIIQCLLLIAIEFIFEAKHSKKFKIIIISM
jgi:hypothetical protein